MLTIARAARMVILENLISAHPKHQSVNGCSTTATRTMKANSNNLFASRLRIRPKHIHALTLVGGVSATTTTTTSVEVE